MAFLGINSNAHDPKPQVAEQVRKHGIDFPVLKDPATSSPTRPWSSGPPRSSCSTAGPGSATGGRSTTSTARETQEARGRSPLSQRRLDAILAGRPRRGDGDAVAGCLLDRVEPKAIKVNTTARVRPAPPEIQAAREGTPRQGPDGSSAR